MPRPEVRSQDGSNLIMSRVSIKKDQLRLLIHFRSPRIFLISRRERMKFLLLMVRRPPVDLEPVLTDRSPETGLDEDLEGVKTLPPLITRLSSNPIGKENSNQWGASISFYDGFGEKQHRDERGSNIFRRKSQIKQFLVEMMSKFFTSVGRSCNEF